VPEDERRKKGAELLNRELLAIPHESSSIQQPMVAAARRVIETQTSAPEGNIRARTILALRAVTQIPELFTSTDEVLDTIKVLAAEQTLSNQALLALGQLLRLFRVPTESSSATAKDLNSTYAAQSERFYVFQTAAELCELIKTEVVPFLKSRRGKEEKALKISAELMEVARLSGVKEASASPRHAFRAASKFMNEYGDNALPALFLCHVACQHGKTINAVLSHAFRRMMKDSSGLSDAFYWYSSLKPGQNEVDISHPGLIEGIAQWRRARSEKWIEGRKECGNFVHKRLDELESPHSSGIQALPSDRLKGIPVKETESAHKYLRTSQIYHLCTISTIDRRLEIHTVLTPKELTTWLKEERSHLLKALENPSTWSRSLFSRSPISSELLVHLLGVLHPENPENNTFDLPLAQANNDQRQRLVADVRRSPTPRAVREVTRVLMGLASLAPRARRASGEAPFSIAQGSSSSPLKIPIAEPMDVSRYSKELPMISYGIILREFSGIFSEGRDIGVAGAVHQLRQLAIKLPPDPLSWRKIVTSNRGGVETLLELLKCPGPLPSTVERTLKVGVTALVPQENLPDGIELLADPYAPPLSRVIVSLEFLKVAKRTLLRHAQNRHMQSAQQDLLRSFSLLFDVSLLDSMENEMKPREKVGSNRGIEGFFTNASLLDYIGHMSDTCATRRYSVRGERSNMALLILIDPQAPLNCPAVVGAVGVIGAEGTMNGKTVRCLMLRGVNPRASLLRTVPAAALYRRIVARVAELGVANDFDYIVAPDDDRTGMTLSNRRELVHYQSEHFSNPVSNPMILLKDVDSIRFNTYPRFDPREGSREWACRVIGRCDKLAQGNL
jgi:hypothetical protein